jgi:hypothetical protein
MRPVEALQPLTRQCYACPEETTNHRKESQMFRFNRTVLIAGFVATGGLGVFALSGSSALAFGPQPAVSGLSLVVPIMDEEDSAIEKDLEPDEVPKTKSGGEMIPVPDRASTDGDDVEDEELKRDLETGE